MSDRPPKPAPDWGRCLTVRHRRIALLTGASITSLSSTVAPPAPGWNDDIPLSLRVDGVVGVSYAGDYVYRNQPPPARDQILAWADEQWPGLVTP